MMAEYDPRTDMMEAYVLWYVLTETEKRERIAFDFMASGAFPRDLVIETSARSPDHWRIL